MERSAGLRAATLAGMLLSLVAIATAEAQTGDNPALSQPATLAPVDPLSPGFDSFPSKGRVVFEVPGSSKQQVVQLSSEGPTDTVVQRGPLVGNTIDTEIVQMQLQGTHPLLGPIIVRVGRQFGLPPSQGQVQNVRLGPDGRLISGDSVFNVFSAVSLTQSGVHASNDQPLRMATTIHRLPPNVPTPTPAEATDIDHYKCYDVKPRGRSRSRTVRLEDQFENASARVQKPLFLCNPVRKNRASLRNARDHLACYRIKQKGAFSKLALGIRNQFRSETVDATARDTVCLPSRKLVVRGKRRAVPGPKSPPKPLDHFKCYKVQARKPAPGRVVQLDDQFESHRTPVSAPSRICNPVSKTAGKRKASIGNPLAHLVAYPIKQKKIRRTVIVRNQFGSQALTVVRRRFLLVPSHKTNCSEYAENMKIALNSSQGKIATINQAIHVPYQDNPDGDCP